MDVLHDRLIWQVRGRGHKLFSLKGGLQQDASLLPARHRFEPPRERPGPSSHPIHRSTWKRFSQKFGVTAFSEVELPLYRNSRKFTSRILHSSGPVAGSDRGAGAFSALAYCLTTLPRSST